MGINKSTLVFIIIWLIFHVIISYLGQIITLSQLQNFIQYLSYLTEQNHLRFLIVGVDVFVLWLVHYLDRSRKLYGIGNLYEQMQNTVTSLRKVKRPLYRIDADLISVYLTKQSVFSAIIIGLLAYYLIDPQIKSPGITEPKFVLCGLFVSLVLSIGSILCYDYSYRFLWNSNLTLELLGKGLRLDVLSFYSLGITLLIILSFKSFSFFIGLNLFFGIVLAYYYFFNYNQRLRLENHQDLNVTYHFSPAIPSTQWDDLETKDITALNSLQKYLESLTTTTTPSVINTKLYLRIEFTDTSDIKREIDTAIANLATGTTLDMDKYTIFITLHLTDEAISEMSEIPIP